jgi:hypothetical protein
MACPRHILSAGDLTHALLTTYRHPRPDRRGRPGHGDPARGGSSGARPGGRTSCCVRFLRSAVLRRPALALHRAGTWRPVDRGAGSDARPLEYYFGATGGGVWKTTDGGATWQPVADAALKTSSVGALAIAPSNPDVVYVGMGETQLRGNIIQGDGVYRTTDGGKTWTHAGLEGPAPSAASACTRPIRTRLRGGPRRSVRRDEERGVFKLHRRRAHLAARAVSRRAHWRGRSRHRSEQPRTLYATLWEVFRTPHSLSSGGPGSGLFKTTDGGGTWTELTRNPGCRSRLGQERHQRVGGRLEPSVRDDRSARGRALRVGRRRRDLAHS